MMDKSILPTRPLGKTGHQATLFALGGEGVLRTHGRQKEAAVVIARALDLGVNYCDTAPAYASSLDYYGATLGEHRKEIFLASKTADRTRDGSLRILDDSLRRLRTDHLDLWQLHDLRGLDEVETIFSKHGAIHALEETRREKRVRFLGLTGHHDPAVLLEAIRRFEFDTVLVALSAADPHRLSFIKTVLPEAARRGMGVIAMKVYAAGELVRPRGPLDPGEALQHTLWLVVLIKFITPPVIVWPWPARSLADSLSPVFRVEEAPPEHSKGGLPGCSQNVLAARCRSGACWRWDCWRWWRYRAGRSARRRRMVKGRSSPPRRGQSRIGSRDDGGETVARFARPGLFVNRGRRAGASPGRRGASEAQGARSHPQPDRAWRFTSSGSVIPPAAGWQGEKSQYSRAHETEFFDFKQTTAISEPGR